MKSIKAQIMLVIICFSALLSVVFGIVSCYLNYTTATQLLIKNLENTAVVASDQLAIEVMALQNIAKQAGLMPLLSDETITVEEKGVIVQEHSDTYGVTRGNLLGADGISYFDGNDYTERDYFQASMNGEVFISDPTLSKLTGKIVFLISAPLWKDGVAGGEIVGVVYFVPDANFLNEIVTNIKVGETGSGYILNREGVYVACNEVESVGARCNIESALIDETIENMATMEKEMIAGKNGFAAYSYDGVDYVQGYAPIENTDGWSIGVFAQQHEFMNQFYMSIVMTILLAGFFILLAIIISLRFANKLSRPIIECTQRIVGLGQGDLHTAIKVSERKDEIGVLQKATVEVIDNLQEVVEDITGMLLELADRNLDFQSNKEYRGDFIPIGVAIERITDSLNGAIGQIGEASVKVETGSESVSGGAQKLSEGTTEQASSIEELAATMIEMSDHIKVTAEYAVNANRLSIVAEEAVEKGNVKMNEVSKAMEKISETSHEIAKIIVTIDGIASQTNMLSLNAAIEAARVGVAGAGFAVVSEEIGKLAAESTKAAKNTAVLIEDTLKAVADGVQVVVETAEILEAIVESTQRTTKIVDEISIACNQQEESANQITKGVDQISYVVQNNAMTATESATSSEQLMEQSSTLKELVQQFKLRK